MLPASSGSPAISAGLSPVHVDPVSQGGTRGGGDACHTSGSRASLLALLSAVCIALLSCSNLFAQATSSTNGEIIGTVTDASGAMIPGATIVLSGAGVMGRDRVTSGERGDFRFPDLQPGEYNISASREGFATQTINRITTRLGFTATVDVILKAGSTDQTISVEASGTAIDTQSTTVTTHFDEKRLDALPGSRDYWAVLAQAPAISIGRVDVGGSNALTQQSYVSYGLTSGGGVNRGMVEGVMVNEGAGGGGSDMYYTDYGALAEMAVNAVGNNAEMPSPGVFSQLVVKTGGNQYHGGVYFDYENAALESTNIDQNQINAGLVGSSVLSVYDTNRINKFSDFNANLGGFIKKDKLWWYFAYRYTSTDQRYPTLLDDSQKTTAPVYTGKMTYNLTSKQKITGFYQHAGKIQPDYLGAIFISGGRTSPAQQRQSSVWNSTFPTYVWKAEYDYIISPSLLLEARFGQYHSNWTRTPKSSLQRAEDTGNNYVDGGLYSTNYLRSRPQVNSALTWVKSGWGGSHTFKFGGEYMRDTVEQPFGNFGNSCNCVTILNGGALSFLYLYRPSISKNGLSTIGLYANDVWQINRRLNLSLGVRMDRQNAFLPAQTGADGTSFAAVGSAQEFFNYGPRVGITYDLRGDHKSLIKSSFGMFYLYPGADFGNNVNPNPAGWYTQYSFTAAAKAACTGDACRWSGNMSDLTPTPVATFGGTAATIANSNLKNTNVLQGTLYFEQEVAHDFTVRTGFVWNGRRNVYQRVYAFRPFSAFDTPVSVKDPGPDGKSGTADDGTITAYQLNPAYATTRTSQTIANVPEGSNYYTWEITASKQAGRKWSLLTSFAKTWAYETSLGATTAFTQNAFINAPGGINTYNVWQGKVNATYRAKWDVVLTPVLRVQSGTPFGRTLSASLTQGSTTLLTEPYSTRRTPTIAPIDLRGEKVFRIRDRFSVTGFADLYNIFNTNAIQATTVSTGTSFLRPTAITGPRIARFGAKFQF